MPYKWPGHSWWYWAYEQKEYFPLMKESEYMSLHDHKISYERDSLVPVSFHCPWGGTM